MKIRKWFFKLLTGYDLVEYQEILHTFQESLDHTEKVIKLNREILDNAKEILDNAKVVNNNCKKLIAMYEEVKKNETLG